MFNSQKFLTLAASVIVLTLTACTTTDAASPQAEQQMAMDHMEMSKLSPECQTMMAAMKTKMAAKHEDGGMMEHDMSKMAGHDTAKMQEKMAKHKVCMAEMKALHMSDAETRRAHSH